MPNSNRDVEVDVVSAFVNTSLDQVRNRLRQLKTPSIKFDEHSLADVQVITIEFESKEGKEYAALSNNLIVCTSPEALRDLAKNAKLDIRPGIFCWAAAKCPGNCNWLIESTDSILVRACFLRSRDGDTFVLFDSPKDEPRRGLLNCLKSLLKAEASEEDAYFLTSVGFSVPGDGVEEIMVDFDGFATIKKGNVEQDEKWILEGLKEYARIWAVVKNRIKTQPEKERQIPEWLRTAYMERRWDKETS